MGIATCLSLWGSPASAQFSFTGLGDLAGGDFYSVATGVSVDGSVVVGYSDSGSSYEAFRWTSGGGMVGLGYRGLTIIGTETYAKVKPGPWATLRNSSAGQGVRV